MRFTRTGTIPGRGRDITEGVTVVMSFEREIEKQKMADNSKSRIRKRDSGACKKGRRILIFANHYQTLRIFRRDLPGADSWP